jgi:central glycolytic genes regulator
MEIQKQIIPEILELMDLRYRILLMVQDKEPVGRRQLAGLLDVSERNIRNEIDFFLKEGFVEVRRQGIELTLSGKTVLLGLKEIIYAYKNFDWLAEECKHILGINKVLIIPGDSETSNAVLGFMGQRAATHVLGLLKAQSIIGVTGGRSVAAVAENMPEAHSPKVTVLPARGGMGKSHATQSNSIAALMAAKLGAQKEMMYLPDNIDREILEALKMDPQIKEVFDKLKEMDILIVGIGRADVMAKARNLPTERIRQLEDQGACAEAFGYYFDRNGVMVFPSSSVGITLEQYREVPHVVAVAGGAGKADAILATSRVRSDMVLVTDESGARAIVDGYKGNNK